MAHKNAGTLHVLETKLTQVQFGKPARQTGKCHHLKRINLQANMASKFKGNNHPGII